MLPSRDVLRGGWLRESVSLSHLRIIRTRFEERPTGPVLLRDVPGPERESCLRWGKVPMSLRFFRIFCVIKAMEATCLKRSVRT